MMVSTAVYRRIIRAISGKYRVSEETAMECVHTALGNIKDFSRIDPVAPYLYVASRNVLFSRSRTRRRKPRLLRDPDIIDQIFPAKEEEEKEDYEIDFSELRKKLTSSQVRLYNHLTEGLVPSEIAEIEGITPGTVSTRKRALIRRIQYLRETG